MSEQDQPQIYLATPRQFDLSAMATALPGLLKDHEIACLRLDLDADEASVIRSADTLRDICHAHDVAIVIRDHVRLVKPHGLDGVHLSDGARQLRDTRKDLGPDAIIGCYCGASKHAGLTAGEIGADYVTFGPLSLSALGHDTIAERDLFEWWAMMIEVPVVAEGGLTPEIATKLAPNTDFFCLRDEVWTAENGPDAALRAFRAAIA